MALATESRAATEKRCLFSAPYHEYTPDALLRHFRHRRAARFFPVVDAEETQRQKVDAILDNRYQFIGESHVLSDPPPWIDNPSDDREWHILLHKFYYAVGMGIAFQESGDMRYLDKWITLTSSWIAHTPPGFIASDVTGRRVQNWIYAYYYFVLHSDAPVPAGFHREFLASLHVQVEYLIHDLHPARNHRTLELYAIFLAAVAFPEFANASRWSAFSLAEIVRNMEADLLPDGVHCELSTDYHHLVLKNYLCVRRLAQLNGIPVPAQTDAQLVKALEFSIHAHKPDGLVPSLSDGDVHSYLDLLRQGHALYGREDMLYVATAGAQGKAPARRSAAFAHAGYYVMRSGWGEHEPFADERYLIFDCGPLGAGNHGHFDLLNIEAAAYGHALIVDPGRYTYYEDSEVNWRARFRGTAYHNTVLVDGKNQTRYLPGPKRYKVKGPAPRHELRTFVTGPGFDYVHGIAASSEYDAVHERRIAFICPEYWIISDTLTATQPHRYDLLFHLSAAAENRVTVKSEGGTCRVETPNLVLAQCETPEVGVAIDRGFVSYRYGQKDPAPIVRFTREAADTTFHTVVYPYRDEPPVLSVREVPVWSDDGSAKAANALCVAIGQDESLVTDFWFFNGDSSRLWRCNAYSFDGHYVLVRKNAHGHIVRMHCSPGARFEARG